MRIAYFHCFSGISGDMTLGSLVDAGVDEKELIMELQKIPLEGYQISFEVQKRRGLAGTKCDVLVDGHQPHRHLEDIIEIIDASSLPDVDKSQIKRVFHNLAHAEARVHGQSSHHVHFHEVGAVDSIVDIAGAVIGLRLLGIEAVYASPLHLGSGFVECQHGTIPIPAPATLELLTNTPVYSTGIDKELVTPTGAALMTSLAASFGPMPAMELEVVGYGVGSAELPIPNLLRVVIGQTSTDNIADQVLLLETNLDDMNPEIYEHVMESLFSRGALDVFLTPIIMKKSRPGIVLSVLCPLELEKDMKEFIFEETTTIGLRVSQVERRKLPRELCQVQTGLGPVQVKLIHGAKGPSYTPEYESCRQIAKENDLALKDVYNTVIAACLEGNITRNAE